MFIRKKKYRSGNVGVIVVEKVNGKMNELTTIGIARHQEEIDSLIAKGHKWMDEEQERRHPRLDLFGEERKKCDAELLSAEQMLSYITNVSINGADLILDRVFDNVGFNRIDDEVFRQLVKARLSYPASKAATVSVFCFMMSLHSILNRTMRMNFAKPVSPRKGVTITLRLYWDCWSALAAVRLRTASMRATSTRDTRCFL